MTLTCTACCDDFKPEQIFCCPAQNCEYMLCTSCIRRTFDDPSGRNYTNCPSCHHPIARSMIKYVLGRGAISAVEQELRVKVELEMQCQYERRERAKKDMNQYKERARELYNELCDSLNLRCPRCKMVFNDYSGCNALRCGNPGCSAAFCAICLQDCGSDAHPHARTHGNLFDKDLFEKGKKNWSSTQANRFFVKISGEPYEVQQLVQNSYKDSLTTPSSTRSPDLHVDRLFVAKSMKQLQTAIRNDRLGLLRDREDDLYRQNGLNLEHISPRCTIPEDYKLEIKPTGENNVLRVLLSYRENIDLLGRPRWRRLDVSDFDEETEKDGDRPKVDALVNVVRSLKCGVIAFEGARTLYQSAVARRSKDSRQLGNDEISLLLNLVAGNGEINSEDIEIQAFPYHRIIGISQNQRLLLLERHLKGSEPSDLMFDALRDFVSGRKPERIFNEIIVPAPETFNELNEEQKRVAHPLLLKRAIETAGPPGTGKTKTITELIRSILECTDASAIVLSERNGAIDAIADKFVSRCLKPKKTGLHEVVDINMWNNLLTFGSKGGIGPSTSLFTLEGKLRYHPELVELRRILDGKKKDQKKITKSIIDEILARLQSLVGRFSQAAIHGRTRLLSSITEPGFQTRLEIIHSIRSCCEDIENLLTRGLKCTARDIEDVVVDHSSILGGLIPIDGDKKVTISESIESLSVIAGAIKPLLKLPDFCRESAASDVKSIRDSEESLKQASERISLSLETKARVLMCTIGSSHKLPIYSLNSDEDSDSSDFVKRIDMLSVSEQQTIAIFDEAGCIPSYELLGLSRLGRCISGIVAVGDKHQLPPYDPGQSFGPKRKDRNRVVGREAPKVSVATVSSILDASKCSVEEETKIKLTTQYRVPRDIAEVLNARIYKGDYKTPQTCSAPDSGLVFIDVPQPQNNYRLVKGKENRYVNRDELEVSLQLIHEIYREKGTKVSIMLLTPYKKQQRLMEFSVKEARLPKDVNVLTIDQCQGQEADYVMLSLVQRPTMFLDKHRLNVALSRVRQRLYIIGSRAEFRIASQNSSWDCALIAKDLLELTDRKSY